MVSRLVLALDELFSQQASRLVDHPGLDRPGRVTGTRELVARQNYTLITIRPATWYEYYAFCTLPGSNQACHP